MLPSHGWFLAHLDRPCLIGPASEEAQPPRWPARLVEVGERRLVAGHEQFAVVFLRTDPHPPEQGLFAVAFEGAGPIDMLLVPIGQDASGVRYEACFNRPVAPAAGA